MSIEVVYTDIFTTDAPAPTPARRSAGIKKPKQKKTTVKQELQKKQRKREGVLYKETLTMADYNGCIDNAFTDGEATPYEREGKTTAFFTFEVQPLLDEDRNGYKVDHDHPVTGFLSESTLNTLMTDVKERIGNGRIFGVGRGGQPPESFVVRGPGGDITIKFGCYCVPPDVWNGDGWKFDQPKNAIPLKAVFRYGDWYSDNWWRPVMERFETLWKRHVPSQLEKQIKERVIQCKLQSYEHDHGM